MINYKEEKISNLLNLAQNDDKIALDEIVRRYHLKIQGLFGSLKTNFDSEDLTQEVLLKMSKSIKKLNDLNLFDVWLRRIVYNVFKDSLRKKKNKIEIGMQNPLCDKSLLLQFGESLIDKNQTPCESALACELSDKIYKAINNLSPLLKSVVLLREFDGLSYKEISKLLDLNIGTVKSRLARARTQIKQELLSYLKQE